MKSANPARLRRPPRRGAQRAAALYAALFFFVSAGAAQPLPLSLRQAVDLALAPDGNARVAIAAELVNQARARQSQSRASLLPNVGGGVSQQNVVRNLEAFGLRIESPFPGVSIPSIVGPFNVFDARLTASQTIFNLGDIRRYQSARSQTDAARADNADTRDETTAAVARAYVGALLAQQELETAQADVALAQDLLNLAQRRVDAGSGIRIEAARADVQLADRRQTLLVRQNASRAAQLQLARLLGVSFERELQLTSPLESPTEMDASFEAGMQEALAHRADWHAQSLRERAAQRASSAAKWDRLPSLTAFGDYGTIGPAINEAQPTRTIGASLQVPIFNGGRSAAVHGETASRERQESIRARDLRQQIELELRLALDALTSASAQTDVAESGLRLAQEEEERAQRRFDAGVGSSIEVTDAQTRLARARQNRIEAVARYNIARIDWAEARGRIETIIP